MTQENENKEEESNIPIEKSAIDKKANEADGAQINHQIKQRKEQHQPRDNA